MRRDLFVGLDQTGAVDRRGTPRPLPGVVLGRRGKDWRLEAFYLPRLEEGALRDQLTKLGFPYMRKKLALLLDCVLGVPAAANPKNKPLSFFLKRAAEADGYGRAASRRFFQEILAECSDLAGNGFPKRKVELLTGSNSVFQLHPFQKNIQTGSYRFWKELGSESDWYFVASQESPDPELALVLEAYPSLAWKSVFQVQSRRPDEFLCLFRKRFPEISVSAGAQRYFLSRPDFSDAAMMALQARIFPECLKHACGVRNKEGWILGAEQAENKEPRAKPSKNLFRS